MTDDQPQSKAPRPQKAVALKYDREKDTAPRVVAKGRDDVAKRILAIAEEHGIHTHKDEDLVEILDRVELDTAIPLEVYSVVAEIFAYLYRMNRARTAAPKESTRK